MLTNGIPVLNRIVSAGSWGVFHLEMPRRFSLGQQWGQPTGGGTPVPGTTPTSPSTAPSGSNTTEISLTVYEPNELKPLPGAKVSVSLHKAIDRSVVSGNIAEGVTDSKGKFFYIGQVPGQINHFFWKLDIKPGPGQNFPAKSIDAATRNNASPTGNPRQVIPEVVVCPAGTDPVICDAAQAQIVFASVYEHQLIAWHYYSSGRPEQVANLAADMAHASVRFTTSAMNSHWDVFSWWVGDLDIPPKDWPNIVKNYDKTLRLFNEIPFPKIENLNIPDVAQDKVVDLFKRCARAIPIWKEMSIINPRLYSESVGGYFPRDDFQIHVDMAFSYYTNAAAIGQCMEWKIKQKIKEIQRSAKTFAMLGTLTTFMLAPLAGGAAPTVLLTEVAELVSQEIKDEPVPISPATNAAVTAGVSLIAGNPAAVKQVLGMGIDAMFGNNMDKLDPIVQKIIKGLVGELIDAAVVDTLSGIYGAGTSSTAAGAGGALNATTLMSLGSATVVFAIKFITSTIKGMGVKGVKGLKNVVLGMEHLDTILIPFTVWCLVTLAIDALFDEAAAQLEQEEAAAGGGTGTTPGGGSGTTPGGELPEGDTPLGDIDFIEDVIYPEIDRAREDGVEVPSSIGGGPTTLGVVAGVGAGAVLLAIFGGVLFGKS